MTYPFRQLLRDPEQHADLVSLGAAAEESGTYFDLVKSLRGDPVPERQLLLAWALSEMAATGVHIDDVHFDCQDAVQTLEKTKASPGFAEFADLEAVSAYETALRQRMTRAFEFAARQGLPLTRPARDEELGLMNRLISEGAQMRETDPEGAAKKLSAALELSRKRGAETSYVECELALARAAAVMSDETIAAIAPIARRQVFSKTGDNGQHYGPAVWLTLRHLALAGRPKSEILAFWDEVKLLERPPERKHSIGLRDRSVLQRESLLALEQRQPKTARVIKAFLDGEEPRKQSWLDWFRT